VRLQRAARLPQATAAGQRAHCARVTALLLGEADEAVVSAPRMDGDLPLRPSPLAPSREIAFEALFPLSPPGERAGVRGASSWAEVLAATRTLETLDDFQAPALPGAEAKGGTWALKDFSDCPFKALATRRLHAEKLETPPAGPDAKTRGSLVHQVMEQVWLALKDHTGLVSRSAEERAAVVREAVDGALKHMRARLPDLYPPPFVALERERLTARVLEWLAIEAKRTPFTVRGRESEERIQVGPLTLHAFIDRVDELEDGSLAIIDYKTGKATKSKWAPPRPEEPQLPIYALHQTAPVGAVLYARLKAGEMGFDGYASDEKLVVPAKQDEFKVNQPKEGFEETLAGWEAALAQLAEGYAQGHAAVAPRKRAVTCRYCHVAPLCRIGELGLADEEGSDE
jgi:probable DNA repair protein